MELNDSIARDTSALSTALVALIAVSLLLIAQTLWREALRRHRYSKFPLLEVPFPEGDNPANAILHLERLYAEGYRSLRDQIHRINTPDAVKLIIPNKYLDELRKKSDDELDVLRAFQKALENNYLHTFPGGLKTRITNSVVKKELTRNLAKVHPALCIQVTRTLSVELPPCGEWTSVQIHSHLLRMVAIISGQVFVGPALCQDEAYIDVAVRFTTDIVNAVPVLKSWHRWLRWWANRVEPAVEKVRQDRKQMAGLLAPVISARRAAKSEGGKVPDDLLQWMIERAEEHGVTSIEDISNMQLLLTMAAIHTTTLTTTFIIYDLVSRPEVVAACRKEIREVLKETDGVMTIKALFNMKLLDSVMRESQRLNPPFLDAFRRYICKDVTLSDGTVLPKGSLIETANRAVLMDPELYLNPESFDPFRFVQLRTDPDAIDPIGFNNREQYQFVSVTKENMSFGFGTHACPGRFFGANEIKMILAQILLNFELAWPKGQDGKAEAVLQGAGLGPDPMRMVMMKKIGDDQQDS